MDQSPLVEMVNDGRRLIDAMTTIGIGVSSAFWTKAGDDEQWYLYIASPLVDTVGITEAYRRLHPIVRQLHDEQFSIDPFAIKLISPQSPLVQGAAKLSENYKGITRSGGTQLGGVSVEGAVIYPPALPAKG
jgi:hypothetical protein